MCVCVCVCVCCFNPALAGGAPLASFGVLFLCCREPFIEAFHTFSISLQRPIVVRNPANAGDIGNVEDVAGSSSPVAPVRVPLCRV